MMTAVKAINYSNSAKMGLAMKRRFWEEDDQHLRRPSLLEPADRRVLVSVERLLHAEGRAARPLLERTGRRPARSPVKERIEHVLTAREQGASADPRRVRERLRRVVAKGEVQPGRLRVRLGAARAARSCRRWTTGSSSARRSTAPYSEPDWQEGAVAAGWQALKSCTNARCAGTVEFRAANVRAGPAAGPPDLRQGRTTEDMATEPCDDARMATRLGTDRLRHAPPA